jgi:hypothetical protein
VAGGALLGAIYGEEEKARSLGLAGEALREHRQRCMRPIVNDFERWLDAVEPTLLPSEPLAAAIRYYKNHRDALFRFVDDPEVPFDKCTIDLCAPAPKCLSPEKFEADARDLVI